MNWFFRGFLAARRAHSLATFVAILCLLSARSSSGAILLNEVYANVPGSGDLNQEYIELISTTGGVESMTGLVLLLIDSSGGSRGEITDAYDLSSFSTGTNGLAILEQNFATGPWTSTWDAATTKQDPSGSSPYSGMGNDDLKNDAFTVLLVSNFTGAVDTDYDTDDDGVFESQPWTVIDSVGWQQSGFVDVTYALAVLSQSSYTPDSVARIRGNTDANSAAAWYGGDILGPATNSVTYDFQNFGLGPGYQMTPGYANYPVPEPSSVLLAAFGSLGLVGLAARRKAR